MHLFLEVDFSKGEKSKSCANFRVLGWHKAKRLTKTWGKKSNLAFFVIFPHFILQKAAHMCNKMGKDRAVTYIRRKRL